MDGILFILNQTGLALADAEAVIARLRKELAEAKAREEESDG
jgi:hypothetical protein